MYEFPCEFKVDGPGLRPPPVFRPLRLYTLGLLTVIEPCFIPKPMYDEDQSRYKFISHRVT